MWNFFVLQVLTGTSLKYSINISLKFSSLILALVVSDLLAVRPGLGSAVRGLFNLSMVSSMMNQ